MAGQRHPIRTAGDNVLTESSVLSGHDDSIVGRTAAVHKICVVCGANVAGKPRMKDGEGRYWCYECGITDTQRKHPVPCSDCGGEFPQTELADFQGVSVCTACADKRKLAARREAARIAAAEEEARHQELRRHRLLLAGIIVGCVTAFVLIFWLMLVR
jgi:hypothetical protein